MQRIKRCLFKPKEIENKYHSPPPPVHTWYERFTCEDDKQTFILHSDADILYDICLLNHTLPLPRFFDVFFCPRDQFTMDKRVFRQYINLDTDVKDNIIKISIPPIFQLCFFPAHFVFIRFSDPIDGYLFSTTGFYDDSDNLYRKTLLREYQDSITFEFNEYCSRDYQSIDTDQIILSTTPLDKSTKYIKIVTSVPVSMFEWKQPDPWKIKGISKFIQDYQDPPDETDFFQKITPLKLGLNIPVSQNTYYIPNCWSGQQLCLVLYFNEPGNYIATVSASRKNYVTLYHRGLLMDISIKVPMFGS